AIMTPQPPTNEYPTGSYRINPLASWQVPVDPDGFQPPGLVGQLLVSGAVIDAADIKPIRWPHPLYLSDGLSPLSAGSVTIDVAEQTNRSRWYSFKNTSNPGMLFSIDPSIRPDPADREAFREDLRARANGTPNTGKDLILPAGVT